MRPCLFALLLSASLFGQIPAEGASVNGFVTPVRDLRSSRDFYVNVLGFVVAGSKDVMSCDLVLGEERITLTRIPESPNARTSPPTSLEPGFQHLALVVSDLAAAVARVRRFGITEISASPQVLPNWNPRARRIGAFYFRDPDGNPLELIAFPPGVGDPRWADQKRGLFLGIDHSAVVVEDTEASLRFWRDRCGLKVVGQSLNSGAEQERLGGNPGAIVLITLLRGPEGPGIELLDYLTPTTSVLTSHVPRGNSWSRIAELRVPTTARPSSTEEWTSPDHHRVWVVQKAFRHE